MVTEAPACRALLTQATLLWPNRSKLSDGILSSDAHKIQNPSSDHDYGNAVDLTHDPYSGCDAHAWVRQLVRHGDSRVKYVISNGFIWNAARAAEGWRIYRGDNPHTKHAHISIYAAYRNDTRDWFPKGFVMDATTRQQMQAMLNESEAQIMAAVRVEIGKAVAAITGGKRVRNEKGEVIDPDPANVSIADVYTLVEERTGG